MLSTYMGVTVLCFLLDVICMFATLAHFGEAGHEDQELFLFFMNLIFMGCNVYWFSWGIQLKHELPEDMGSYLQKSFFGLGKKVYAKNKEFRQKTGIFSKNPLPQNPLYPTIRPVENQNMM